MRTGRTRSGLGFVGSTMVARIAHVLRRYPRVSVAGVLLVLAVAGTAVGRWVAVETVRQNPDERREAVVTETFSTIEQRFEGLRNRLRGRAHALAVDSVVVEGLRAWHDENARSTSLVRRVLDAPLDDRTTVEVYTPLPRLLVWNGRRLSMGGAPDEETFLQRPQTEIVTEGTVRTALVVWWPVRRADRVLGVVRVHDQTFVFLV